MCVCGLHNDENWKLILAHNLHTYNRRKEISSQSMKSIFMLLVEKKYYIFRPYATNRTHTGLTPICGVSVSC